MIRQATDLPRIAPGQTWESPQRWVHDRHVVEVGLDPRYPSAGDRVVRHTVGSSTIVRALPDTRFAAWARRSGARPRVEEAG